MSLSHEFPHGRPRCRWYAAAPDFLPHRDREGGFPLADDRRLFETLSLEAFQSGLSWRTILAKRENGRVAFEGFDIELVARFGARDVERPVGDAGIVCRRGTIAAVVSNARRCRDLAEAEGSLAAYVWRHEPDPRELPAPQSASTSAASIALSKELKQRGRAFVGPTTVHAFLQAMGLINDHAEGRAIRAEAAAARAPFRPPAA